MIYICTHSFVHSHSHTLSHKHARAYVRARVYRLSRDSRNLPRLFIPFVHTQPCGRFDSRRFVRPTHVYASRLLAPSFSACMYYCTHAGTRIVSRSHTGLTFSTSTLTRRQSPVRPNRRCTHHLPTANFLPSLACRHQSPARIAAPRRAPTAVPPTRRWRSRQSHQHLCL